MATTATTTPHTGPSMVASEASTDSSTKNFDITTSRLRIVAADHNSASDIEKLVKTFTDPFIGQFGFSRLGLTSKDALDRKLQRDGPPLRLCTNVKSEADLPRTIFGLVYLRSSGDYIGQVGISFRNSMPYPDLGYAFFEQFNGFGYASEAGAAFVRYWRDVVGVREICVMTLDYNTRSQECARRIGFVDGGPVEVIFKDGTVLRGVGFILAGMKWPEGTVKIWP